MNISEKIKILRLKNNFKAADIAKYMGVSTETIRLWETGQSIPRNRNIFKLAKILKVNLDLLKENDLSISDNLILNDENNSGTDYTLFSKENISGSIYSIEFKEALNKNSYLVGRKLTKIRLDRGFTQKEVANGSETAQGTISRIEKGDLQSVSITLLKRITDYLEIDLTLLLEEHAENKTVVPKIVGDIKNSIPKTGDDVIDAAMGKIRELVEWKEKGIITGDELLRFKTKIINDARI